jgi:hypothetical protein
MMVCVLGFWSSPEAKAVSERLAIVATSNPGDDETVVKGGWGPCCPEPALRAWGQEVVDRLSDNGQKETRRLADTRMDDEESDHVVIGRLIRRLKISDAPQRFQSLATTVLRTSLGVDAVAWVPKEENESVVVAGEVRGILARDYRGCDRGAARVGPTVCVGGGGKPGLGLGSESKGRSCHRIE